MKKFLQYAIAFCALLLCVLLVVFSGPAINAARSGVEIWWNTLLPTLFPFFVAASLMQRSGALHNFARLFSPLSKKLRISPFAIPALLLGGISGYPSGARLVGLLQQENSINDEQAQRLGTLCNLCSPMFLIGALASGMFGNTGYFLALAAGHYGGAILTALVVNLLKPIKSTYAPKYASLQEKEPLYIALPRTIATGMGDMLKVGGSVIFFLVLAEILEYVGVFAFLGAPIDRLFSIMPGKSPAHGLLLGLMEMTGGCLLISKTGLPAIITIPLCSFLVSFGGLSIMTQALSFVQFRSPLRYIGTKALHGLLAAIITYLVVYNQRAVLEVFAPAPTPNYATNALTGAAMLLACTLGLFVVYLLSAIAGRICAPNKAR
ncbi:hypothetical protein LJC42_04105 [Eubacteriales bacterium OttesenSCG-928-K08]|nr:hypothetical protein [Eubacteriales bacterium OttesenSCG-928-K08]